MIALLECFVLWPTAYSKLQQAGISAEKSSHSPLQAEVTWFTKVAWNVALLCGDPCEEMHQLFLACYKVSPNYIKEATTI